MLYLSSKELLFSTSFMSKYVVRVALLFGPLASCLATSTSVSWPLVLRLLAFAELLFYHTSLPRLIILRPI